LGWAARRSGFPVCGEVTSDELAIPVLAGLGVREFSVSSYAVPRLKAAIRNLDVPRCALFARQAVTNTGPDEARKLVLTMLS
jgi:phosphoenolpyruvate-protein kinase (PTS system EI component)